jgi:hypothetical protein
MVEPGEGELAADRLKKTLAIPGHFADSHHAASPATTLRVYNVYRQGKPFFIDQNVRRNDVHRSV